MLQDRISAPVSEGDVLARKYRVDEVLGIGGMGVVVAAHHLQLDEKVALKFLLPEVLSNPEAVARFQREARAAALVAFASPPPAGTPAAPKYVPAEHL